MEYTFLMSSNTKKNLPKFTMTHKVYFHALIPFGIEWNYMGPHYYYYSTIFRTRSRMNMDINSIPGMNPPAPDASLGSVNPNPMNQPPPGSMNPGPGSGTPGGPGGSGPDYAALLQYLQYYQKQMGSEESEGKS